MARSRIERSYEILKTYIGTNPTIQDWKRQYDSGRLILSDFQVNYILANHNYQPFTVNRIVKITPEYGQKLQETYGIEFIPTKIKVYDVIGEVGRSYHCRIQFRQSLPPMLTFINRRCFKEDLRNVDYNAVEVDFDSFDKLTEADGRKLKDHQKTAVKFLLANRKAILADSMGLGKQLVDTTPIPTPNGMVEIGKLKPGNKVLSSDGKPHTVMGVFHHPNNDIYRVYFTDNSYCDCGLEHLWIVRTPYQRAQEESNWTVVDTNTMIKSGLKYGHSNSLKYEIPIAQPLQYKEHPHFIDPYTFGALIGNGCFTGMDIRLAISDSKDEMIKWVEDSLQEGYSLKLSQMGRCRYYRITHGRVTKSNLYRNELRRLGFLGIKSSSKYIPEEYLHDSVDNRIKLLQGLMDTNGQYAQYARYPIFRSSSELLARQVKELVCSLGGIAMLRHVTYERSGSTYTIYCVSINTTFPPFRLTSKSEIWNNKKRPKICRKINKIEYIGKADATCISVDSDDHSYVVTENNIVTHNTTSSIVAAMAAESKHVLIITTASLKSTWKRELELYNSPEDIEIIKAGRKWNGTKRYTIINYDLVKNFYQVPMEQAMEKQELKNADGTVTEVMVPVYTKDKKTGHLKPKMVKSRKKATIAECMQNSPLYQLTFDCVIIDEAQKLSRNTSIRYKVIQDFIRRSGIRYVFFLTGTPLTNKPMNLYYILKLLDAEVADDYEYYCTRYCGGYKMKFRTGKEVMVANQATNLEELRHKIKHLYIRRLISDLPDMVHKEISTRYYDLDDKQKAQYDQLWDEYVEAQRSIGNDNSESYRQLVEGTLVRQYLAKEMTANTIELVNELLDDDEKVIIVCTFQDELDIFRKYYGDKCVCYDGRMSDKAKDAAEKAFMNDPKIKVFVGNINAASLGLTLTVARKMVFNSYSWEEIANRQMQDRIWRITQTDDVECIYQLYTDSISQHMFNSVIRKGMIMDEVIKTEKEKNKP